MKSYSAAISACEKGGQWQRALALLKAMCEGRVWPDTPGYNAAVSACEKGKQWELGLHLLEECKVWTPLLSISYTVPPFAKACHSLRRAWATFFSLHFTSPHFASFWSRKAGKRGLPGLPGLRFEVPKLGQKLSKIDANIYISFD